MKTARILLSGALAAALLFAPRAHASSPADQAAAEVLFNDARKLAATGDFVHACPKFVESQRLDPTAGTLLSIGDCYEKIDKLASAWGAFKEAEMLARDAGDSARQAEAARRAEALTLRVSKLTILVPPVARVPGFEVHRNGNSVGEGQWGSAVPIDAGWHDIKVMAPGRKPWATSVKIETNGSVAKVEIPVLELASAEEPSKPPNFWSAQRTAGVVLGGVGLVGLITSAVFTAKLASKNAESKPHCLPGDET